MPLYDYFCPSCDFVFEFEKRMAEDGPGTCPKCGRKKPERYFGAGVAGVFYKDRPPWTYKECLKYKRAKWNDGPYVKIDPKKHGDIGSWHCPGELAEKPAKKKK